MTNFSFSPLTAQCLAKVFNPLYNHGIHLDRKWFLHIVFQSVFLLETNLLLKPIKGEIQYCLADPTEKSDTEKYIYTSWWSITQNLTQNSLTFVVVMWQNVEKIFLLHGIILYYNLHHHYRGFILSSLCIQECDHWTVFAPTLGYWMSGEIRSWVKLIQCHIWSEEQRENNKEERGLLCLV